MKRFIFLTSLAFALSLNVYAQKNKIPKEFKLVFSEEFNKNDKPDTLIWNFEHGFLRNEEHQWYQSQNAYIEKGYLFIEARKEKIKNPNYVEGARSWRKNREYAEYTSASINTRGKKEFLYGRFEIRAKIDTSMGLWPAIWTLGVGHNWPACGEIDVMESYPINGEHHILANVLSMDAKNYSQNWHSEKIKFSHFLDKDKNWPNKFHIWRMDWDENSIKLYLDNELLNETLLSTTLGPDGFQPFHQPHYILLNMAIGGQNGGNPSKTNFPAKYIIDYVRVYQKKP